jgi:hypothetical protein
MGALALPILGLSIVIVVAFACLALSGYDKRHGSPTLHKDERDPHKRHS